MQQNELLGIYHRLGGVRRMKPGLVGSICLGQVVPGDNLPCICLTPMPKINLEWLQSIEDFFQAKPTIYKYRTIGFPRYLRTWSLSHNGLPVLDIRSRSLVCDCCPPIIKCWGNGSQGQRSLAGSLLFVGNGLISWSLIRLLATHRRRAYLGGFLELPHS